VTSEPHLHVHSTVPQWHISFLRHGFVEWTVRWNYRSYSLRVARLLSCWLQQHLLNPCTFNIHRFRIWLPVRLYRQPYTVPRLFHCDLTFQMATVPSDLFLSLKPRPQHLFDWPCGKFRYADIFCNPPYSVSHSQDLHSICETSSRSLPKRCACCTLNRPGLPMERFFRFG
jgi:hypothetical protein